MIAIIDQVPAGNALQIVLQPRGGASRLRVTRGATEAELVDAGAGTVVYEGSELSFMDTAGLVNGTEVWYRAFYWVDGAWRGTPAFAQTPRASFRDYSADPVALVRDRLALGLAEYVRRHRADMVAGVDASTGLCPKTGSIPVLIGTPLYEGISFPCVVLHLTNDSDAVRGIGEHGPADEVLASGEWEQSEGWLSSVTMTVVGYSKNPAERKELRKALKALVIANLAVFNEAGMTQVSFSIGDQDDMTSYSEPMYHAYGTLKCMAPSFVAATHRRIGSIQATPVTQ